MMPEGVQREQGGNENVGGGGEGGAMQMVQREKPIRFPAGYIFKPSDLVLVMHYLKNKIENRPLPCKIIRDVILSNHSPDELVEIYRLWGDDKWYFFTPRDRKYRNGSRPNRGAKNGYWKATGTDMPIKLHGRAVGWKKALVFYNGKPGRGEKTDWIMHEFVYQDENKTVPKSDGTMRLNDWVLCRIQKKRGAEIENKSIAVPVPNQEQVVQEEQETVTNPPNVQPEPHEASRCERNSVEVGGSSVHTVVAEDLSKLASKL